MACCDPTHLCDRCFPAARVRSTREAEAAGVALARELARSIVPDPRWVRMLDAQSDVIAKRVEHLATDPRLATRVREVCAATVRRCLLEPLP